MTENSKLQLLKVLSNISIALIRIVSVNFYVLVFVNFS